jgi:hypothetical protein
MSSAEIVVLLEEGAQRSSELAARATAGATAAADLAEHAQALGLRAVDDAERLHREYVEAVGAIKHAAEQAAQSGEAAAHTVETVSAEATKAGTALKDMLVAVEGEAVHMGEERARLFHTLDEHAHTTEAGFHELIAKVEGFEQNVTNRLKESEESLKKVQERVEQAAGRVAEAEKHLHEQMEQVAQSAAETMNGVVHALEQTLSAIAGGIVTFSNDGVGGHNLAVAAVRQGYLDETKDDPEPEHTYLETSFGTVREAVATLALLPEPAHASLQAPTDAIVEAGEKAVSGLSGADRSLRHSLDVVRR